MIFGFPAKYSDVILYGDRTANEFIVLALETLDTLRWPIILSNNNQIIAKTFQKYSLSGEEFTIDVDSKLATITSYRTQGEIFDRKINKENVESFFQLYTHKASTVASGALLSSSRKIDPKVEIDQKDELTLKNIYGYFRYIILSYLFPLILIAFAILENHSGTWLFTGHGGIGFLLALFCWYSTVYISRKIKYPMENIYHRFRFRWSIIVLYSLITVPLSKWAAYGLHERYNYPMTGLDFWNFINFPLSLPLWFIK